MDRVEVISLTLTWLVILPCSRYDGRFNLCAEQSIEDSFLGWGLCHPLYIFDHPILEGYTCMQGLKY